MWQRIKRTVILATGVIVPRFRSQPPDTLLEPHWAATALAVCWVVCQKFVDLPDGD